MSSPTKILAIETSCDETAVAVLEISALDDSRYTLDVSRNLVSSQIPTHQKYGGVVPEVAARSHVPETVSLVTQALESHPLSTLDAIAVTRGPGLATALRVGVEAARTLAAFSEKPLIGVNHLEGHVASAWLNDENRKRWEYPLLALIVSGGHTELVLVKGLCRYQIIGRTRDDAAGEAFDKSAKLMGIPYPGGPKIAKLADQGNPEAYALPRPMRNDGSFDFSFSGLKTAVRQLWESLEKESGMENREWRIENDGSDLVPTILDSKFPILCNVAASLQAAIVDVLVEKTVAAAKKYHVKGVCVVGGVSANLSLRSRLESSLAQELPNVAYLPSDRAYITDNAAMIAAAGFWRLQKGDTVDWRRIDVRPEWEIG